MLARLLDRLEELYGALAHTGPTDPYELVIWLNCGYPASDPACAKGYAALKAAIGTSPEALLAAEPADLALAMQAGGMVPELRALRLQEIAGVVTRDYAGDLRSALTAPLDVARRVLMRFPTLGEPAADRILLFCGLAEVAVVPSGGLQVLPRLGYGSEVKDWAKTYRSARDALAAELPADGGTLRRAYLLLKAHGQAVCKRTRPVCAECPLTADCRYFQEVVAPAALSSG